VPQAPRAKKVHLDWMVHRASWVIEVYLEKVVCLVLLVKMVVLA